jgi:hypothetical protein
MKKYLSFGLAVLCFFTIRVSKAQFTSGANGFFMKNGALVTIDGLTIAPSADLALNGKTLLLSNVPANDHFGCCGSRLCNF